MGTKRIRNLVRTALATGIVAGGVWVTSTALTAHAASITDESVETVIGNAAVNTAAPMAAPRATADSRHFGCNQTSVSGHIEVSAPYVRMLVYRVDPLFVQVATAVVPVQPDGSYYAVANYSLLPDGTPIVISIGEWDGSAWVDPPADNFGARCTTSEALDDRINPRHGDGYAAIYPRQDSNGNPDLHLYCIDAQGVGRLGDILTQEMFDKAPAKPATNTLVDKIDACRVPIKVYVLTTGEYQINIGPDQEGKTHEVIFTGLPPSHVYFKHFDLYKLFK